MTKLPHGPKGAASKTATSGDVACSDLRGRVEHWGGGVIKVELTDRERVSFAAVVRFAAQELIADVERDDPALAGQAADRLLAVLAIPRTGRPLWESLAKGAHGHGARSTTFRLYRRSALVWAHLLLVPSRGCGAWAAMPRHARRALASIASRLVLASFVRHGGRRRTVVDAAEAARLLAAAKRRGRGAIKATAARLACDERAIGRALKRHEDSHSPTGVARALLDGVAAWGLRVEAKAR